MDKESIRRINELAAKAKTPEGLTEAEQAERKKLREEYIAAFRASLQSQLDNMYYIDDDGNEQKIQPKTPVVH